MMSEEKIKMGRMLLELEEKELKEDGTTVMKFIVENEGEREIIVVPAPEDIIDIDAAKGAVFAHVRERIAEMRADTVYHVSDAWSTEIDEAKRKPELLRLIREVGTKRAAEMGLVIRREALMCQIATRRGGNAFLRWFYRRDGKSIVMEERHEKIDPDEVLGRFSKLFS